MLNELAERVRTLEALVASGCARKSFSQLDKDCAMEIVRHIYNDLLLTECFSEEEEPEIEVSLYGTIDEEGIEAELEHFVAEHGSSLSENSDSGDSDLIAEQKEEILEEEISAIEAEFTVSSALVVEPQDEPFLDEEEPEPAFVPETHPEPQQYVVQKEEEYLPEMEEQVVYINNDDEFDASFFELSLSDDEFDVIKEELCEGDEVECRALVRKLNNFNDFDEAILYIQENYSEYNGRVLEILAEKLTEKLV